MGTELNPRTRIAELQRRKAAINAEIVHIGQGRLDIMEPTQILSASPGRAGVAQRQTTPGRKPSRGPTPAAISAAPRSPTYF